MTTAFEFDHHTAEHAAHWREIFADARATCPVIQAAGYGGFHVLTRHADIVEALKDHKSFSSARTWDDAGHDVMKGIAIPPQPIRNGFLEMDPPESVKYRRLLSKWFTRGSIERGRGRIRESADWAIDRIIADGRTDVVTELVTPFQSVMFLDLLGVPLENWREYKRVADSLTAQEPDGHEGISWMKADLREQVVRQRGTGGEGLIAELALVQVDGAPLPDDLAAELAVMLVLGGEGNVVSVTSSVLRHLHENPSDRARLVGDPDLMASVVDEVLRFYAPAPGLARTVTTPVTLSSGQSFQPGDRVLLSYASANYDEDVFTDADRFDITRSPNPHLSLGLGVHRCIGALLARANIEVLSAAILERMPDFAVVTGEIRPYTHAALSNGYFAMPMTFSPGPPLGPTDGLPILTAARIAPEGFEPTD